MFQRTFVLTEEHFRPAQVVIRMSEPRFFFEGPFDQLFRTRPVASLNGQYSQFVAREYIERIDFELTLKRGFGFHRLASVSVFRAKFFMQTRLCGREFY